MCSNYTICVWYAVFVFADFLINPSLLSQSRTVALEVPACWSECWFHLNISRSSFSPLPGAQGDFDHSREFSNAFCPVLRLCFFLPLTLHEEIGMGAQACICLRNGTSHLMHSFTLTFNHLNSMLLLLSLYYCHPSPTWPHEKLHRRAEKPLESLPL